MAQEWYTAQTEMPRVAAATAAFELRPLSLGELLDRAFAVYRARFWLFAGIAALYAAFSLVIQLANLLVKHVVVVRHGFTAGTIYSVAGIYVVLLLILVPAAITQAATVHAVSEVYLGNETTALGSLRATIGRWYRYLGIIFWMVWSLLWMPALLFIPAAILIAGLRGTGFAWLGAILAFLGVCALPYGFWALLRNALGIQVAVVEGATVREAMRRSKTLTIGAKGRILVVALITWALSLVAATLQAPLLIVIARSPRQEHLVAQALSLIVNSLASIVVTPVGLIGLSLLYFDQRVRQEGFDLLWMLGPEATAVPSVDIVSADAAGDHAAIE